jgi:hypothetical protein
VEPGSGQLQPAADATADATADAEQGQECVWGWMDLIFHTVYRRIALPSFLINYFGQKRIGKLLFLAENGSIKKTFHAKRGPNRPKTG